MSGKIEFWTKYAGLSQIPEICPKPLSKYVPDWWKNIPNDIDATVKQCPSFADYFSNGFVMPAWCDVKIKIDNGHVHVETPYSAFQVSRHTPDQFKDHIPLSASEKIQEIFKLVSPWCISVPDGYSIYQMPLIYNFNEDFSALVGVVHADHYHEIHTHIAVHSSKTEFMINRGDPLSIIMPFKREKFSLIVRERDTSTPDQIAEGKSAALANTKFEMSYQKFARENVSYE